MTRWVLACTMVGLCIFVVGCSKKLSDQDAIRASIDKHLNDTMGLNLSAMDREVKQISVDGDFASAQVEFRLKQGDARMEIEYTLQRQGNEWAVQRSTPMRGGASNPGGPNQPGSPDGGPDSPPQGYRPTN